MKRFVSCGVAALVVPHRLPHASEPYPCSTIQRALLAPAA